MPTNQLEIPAKPSEQPFFEFPKPTNNQWQSKCERLSELRKEAELEPIDLQEIYLDQGAEAEKEQFRRDSTRRQEEIADLEGEFDAEIKTLTDQIISLAVGAEAVCESGKPEKEVIDKIVTQIDSQAGPLVLKLILVDNPVVAKCNPIEYFQISLENRDKIIKLLLEKAVREYQRDSSESSLPQTLFLQSFVHGSKKVFGLNRPVRGYTEEDLEKDIGRLDFRKYLEQSGLASDEVEERLGSFAIDSSEEVAEMPYFEVLARQALLELGYSGKSLEEEMRVLAEKTGDFDPLVLEGVILNSDPEFVKKITTILEKWQESPEYLSLRKRLVSELYDLVRQWFDAGADLDMITQALFGVDFATLTNNFERLRPMLYAEAAKYWQARGVFPNDLGKYDLATIAGQTASSIELNRNIDLSDIIRRLQEQTTLLEGVDLGSIVLAQDIRGLLRSGSVGYVDTQGKEHSVNIIDLFLEPAARVSGIVLHEAAHDIERKLLGEAKNARLINSETPRHLERWAMVFSQLGWLLSEAAQEVPGCSFKNDLEVASAAGVLTAMSMANLAVLKLIADFYTSSDGPDLDDATRQKLSTKIGQAVSKAYTDSLIAGGEIRTPDVTHMLFYCLYFPFDGIVYQAGMANSTAKTGEVPMAISEESKILAKLQEHLGEGWYNKEGAGLLLRFLMLVTNEIDENVAEAIPRLVAGFKNPSNLSDEDKKLYDFVIKNYGRALSAGEKA